MITNFQVWGIRRRAEGTKTTIWTMLKLLAIPKYLFHTFCCFKKLSKTLVDSLLGCHGKLSAKGEDISDL